MTAAPAAPAPLIATLSAWLRASVRAIGTARREFVPGVGLVTADEVKTALLLARRPYLEGDREGAVAAIAGTLSGGRVPDAIHCADARNLLSWVEILAA